MDAEQSKRLVEENTSLLAENRHLYEQITNLVALQDVALALSAELNLDRLLGHIVRSATELLHATASSLLLVDEVTQELVFEIVLGEKGDFLRKRRMKLNEGIAGWVATHGRPTIVNDVPKDHRFKREMGDFDDFKTKAILCAPLAVKGKTVGVIEVLNKTTGPFTREDLGWLAALASQAAVAIDNARLYHNVANERNRLMTIQEEVRKKLARDLHDGPAQTISAIAMGIDYARKLLEKHPERVPTELMQIRTMALQVSRDIRSFMFELRPLMLESVGLIPTLQSYLDRFPEYGGPSAHLEIDGRLGRLPNPIEETAFAIAQEAIGNVRKHASASHIWVELRLDEKDLLLTVKDDGGGFDVAAIETNYGRSGSFGLLNMRERAASIGASLLIQSEPGQGSTVTLKVPVAQQLGEPPAAELATSV